MADFIRLTQINEPWVKNHDGDLFQTVRFEELFINKSVISCFRKLRDYDRTDKRMQKLGARSYVSNYGYFTQTVEEIYNKCNEK